MNRFIMNFKRNVRGAFKSIKSNFKEYICFFLALIMVQVLFGTVTVAFKNNRAVEKKEIVAAGYDYHARLTGMTDVDRSVLFAAYEETLHQDVHYFEYERRADGKDVLHFFGNMRNARNLFAANVLVRINGTTDRVGLMVTPLYEYDLSAGADTPVFLALLGLLMLLSFFLLMALFRIRINHFKFTYSIYMAFGGDFKKLLGGAFYEMMIIALISYIPSLLLTYLICALLYLPFGKPFGFYFLSLPVVLFCSLVCAVLALILPMRVLASGTPVKNMKAQDNSNLVSSPRRSKVILRSKPVKIELLALWRYRKHIALLMVSTVTFAALGVAGCFLADIYSQRTDVKGADLSLSFDSADGADFFLGYFRDRAENYGIAPYVLEKKAHDPYEDLDEYSTELAPHIALPSAAVISPEYARHPLRGDWSYSFAIEFRAFDADALACFEDVYKYKYTGDPARSLADPDTVIVSSTIKNKAGSTLAPGDTVYLPVKDLAISPRDGNALITEDMLLEGTIFIYKPFTVSAVIENYADYDRMLVYLPTVKTAERPVSAYEQILGQEPDYTDVNVYLSGKDDVETVTKFVQNYITNVGGVSLKLDYGDLNEQITRAKNYRGLILVLSLLVFAVSPIAGFFSQILFYEKRKTEFDMIKAVGGTDGTLRKIFFTDAAVLAAVSGAAYVLLSFIAVRLLCAVLNTPFIFALFGKATHASSFSPDMPVLPFIAGLILTLIFASAEVLVCRMLYNNRSKEHLAASFTAEDER